MINNLNVMNNLDGGGQGNFVQDVEKTNEEKKIKTLLSSVDNTFVEVQNKLSFISNIMSDNILIDDVGFRTEKIKEIKKQM